MNKGNKKQKYGLLNIENRLVVKGGGEMGDIGEGIKNTLTLMNNGYCM